MRRAVHLNKFYKKEELIGKAGVRPTMNFSLHMGWTIEGAIGSEFKTDACYLSPHLQICSKIEKQCEHYE